MRSSNAKKEARDWISNLPGSFSSSFIGGSLSKNPRRFRTSRDDVSSSESEGETAVREASVRNQRAVQSSQAARVSLSGRRDLHHSTKSRASPEDHLIEGNTTQGEKCTAQPFSKAHVVGILGKSR